MGANPNLVWYLRNFNAFYNAVRELATHPEPETMQ